MANLPNATPLERLGSEVSTHYDHLVGRGQFKGQDLAAIIGTPGWSAHEAMRTAHEGQIIEKQQAALLDARDLVLARFRVDDTLENAAEEACVRALLDPGQDEETRRALAAKSKRRLQFTDYDLLWDRLMMEHDTGEEDRDPCMRFRDVPWPLFRVLAAATEFPAEPRDVFEFILHPERLEGRRWQDALEWERALWHPATVTERLFTRVVEAEREAVFLAYKRLWSHLAYAIIYESDGADETEEGSSEGDSGASSRARRRRL